MTMTIDDPKFLASWQRVEGCLKCLDENQVERLFSKEYASLSDFHQALADDNRSSQHSEEVNIHTRIKNGDKDRRAMLPCYYVEKSEEVKECA